MIQYLEDKQKAINGLPQMVPPYQKVNFDYDVTPSPYIETVVCENGYLHSSSIPVYIRELEENDDDSININ